MATAKIPQATWESIARTITRYNGGEKGTVANVLAGYGHLNWQNMAEEFVINGGTGMYYYSEWRAYLVKHKIPFREDADGTYMQKKFVKVMSTAVMHILMAYAKKHKMTYFRVGRQWVLKK